MEGVLRGVIFGGGGGGFFGSGGSNGSVGGNGGGGLLGNGAGSAANGGGGGGGTDTGSAGNGHGGSAGAGGAGGTTGGGAGGAAPSGNGAVVGFGGGGGGQGGNIGNSGNGGQGGIFGGGGSGGYNSVTGDGSAGASGAGNYGGGGAGGTLQQSFNTSSNGASGGEYGGGGGGGQVTLNEGNGGNGGFGGGGGGAFDTTLGGSHGLGGPFAGNGGDVFAGGGGGGGLGGSIFLDQNSTLNLQNLLQSISLTGSSATKGTGGGSNAGSHGQDGQAAGQQIFMRNNSILNCQNGVAFTLSGIEGEGTGTQLNMNGTNVLTLIDTVTVNTFNINTGRANCNGTTTATVVVASGATLGGTGSIIGSVTNNGILAPGTSIGTLSVTDMTFTNGSFYDVEILSNTSDLLMASDMVTINGGSILNITVDPGTYSPGETYTVINATNALVKNAPFTIGTITSGYTFQTLYSSNLLQLLLVGAPIGPRLPSSGGNSGNAANTFNTLPSSNPDVASLRNFLTFATNAQLQCDFDSMQPALFNAIPIAQEATTTAVRMTLTDRLGEIHGPRCLQVKCPECGVFYNDRKYKLWLTPLGNFTKQKSRSQHGACDNTKIGFNSNTWGTTLGLDTNPLEYFALGGAVSYAHTDLDWKESAADSQTNSVYGALFGSLFNSYAYLDLAFMGAYDHFDAKRKITLKNIFTTLHRTAKHKEDAGEYDLFAGFGYTFNRNSWQVNPFVNLDYQHLHQGNYKESGAESIDLKVQKRNSNLLRTEAGASFSVCQKRADKSSFSFIEQVKLSYVHETRYDGKKTTSEFIAPPDSSSFVVKGFWPDRDLISPGASFQLVFPTNHLSLDLRYNGEFGKNWHNQTGSLEILYAF